MKIQYKTDGKVIIDCKNNASSQIAITWAVGDTLVVIHDGGNHVEISKDQLLKLGNLIEVIADDLTPDMHSLPRPA